MTRWIRYHFDEDDVLVHYEVAADGCVSRQVDLQGPDWRPVTAAVLHEVLHARDHGGFEAVVAYEGRYGSIADSPFQPEWFDLDGVVEMEGAEFDAVWDGARATLDRDG